MKLVNKDSDSDSPHRHFITGETTRLAKVTILLLWFTFRKTSKQSFEKDDKFDVELEQLKEEQRKAEERRRKEDEAIQQKLKELERRKREREEQEKQV